MKLDVRAKDLTGKTFGKLTVIRPIDRRDRSIVWLCKCSCGNTVEAPTRRLGRSGVSTSSCTKGLCNNRSLGFTIHKETYSSFVNMHIRCKYEYHKFYKNYGGRGITVCKRWRSFKNFFSDMGERPEGTTIDRIDNNKGYSKDNCQWATPLDQRHNRRTA